MVPLEQIYTFKGKSTVPIAIIDLRVALFDILANYEQARSSIINVNDWAKAMWAMRLHRPLPWLKHQPVAGYRVIVVDDFKSTEYGNYWRNIELERGGFETYKGNRSASWAARPEGYNLLLDCLYDYLAKTDCPIKIFRQEGFEADDWAGVAYRAKKKSSRPMFLVTVDTDWSQLVDDKKSILFASTRPYKPRLRSEYECIMWAKKKGMLIHHPREIANLKAEYGDPADCLAPGSPIGVISLIEPTRTPNEALCKELEAELNIKTPNTNKKHLELASAWLARQGMYG